MNLGRRITVNVKSGFGKLAGADSITRNVIALTLTLILPCISIAQTLDVILTGGDIYSGQDAPPNVHDIGIRGDRIVAIGDLGEHKASRRIEVRGLAVVPGFVDIHNHAVRDEALKEGIFRWPDAKNLIRQGVTTVIGGPDGTSPLPITKVFDKLAANPAAVNFGTFVGHGSIRKLAMGEGDRPPSDDELDKMRAEVRKAMQEGAFGLSTGLIYPPGRFATTEEVIELAKESARYRGIYISHMREEGLDLLNSVAETISIGEEAGLPTQLTHHKVVGAPMWGDSVDTLRLVDKANARGIDVSIDQYPYTASHSGLTILFPGWSLDGGRNALIERMANSETRMRLMAEIVQRIVVDRGGNDPENVELASCPHDPTLNGQSLAEVLRHQGREASVTNAAKLVMALVEAGNCDAVYHAMSEEDVKRIMVHPTTMIASDGGVEARSERIPHPRNYGTFARVLGHFARDQHVMPVHTAIHKMSRLPADRIRLADRGRIEVGAIADIAVLDLAKVIDKATFEDPHQYAEGVVHVFVSGVPVLLNRVSTGARPGKILRSR